jgi:3-hydroxyisobutyrate dehydrogenase
MAKVAFLGLGVMGYPMAGHLKTKGGHAVTVYNRTQAKAEKWVAEFGGDFKPTPREAAAGADFVFCCVGNDDDLRSVVLGEDGALAGMAEGAVFIDNTTASAMSRGNSTPRRRKRGSASSTRRSPAARRARRTVS